MGQVWWSRDGVRERKRIFGDCGDCAEQRSLANGEQEEACRCDPGLDTLRKFAG